MGRPFYEYLETTRGKVYVCRSCHCHLANSDELVSKQFHSKSGRAYLFGRCVNVFTGTAEERMMTTGLHLVSDLFCLHCHATVGWKYNLAYEKQQKYKEGKFILERALVLDEVNAQQGMSDDSSCVSDDEDTY